MDPSPDIKKVIVYGVGGVGGYFGARIAEGLKDDPGRQCFFVARGPHLCAIREKGITLETPEKTVTGVPDAATDDIGELPDPDLILLCVKSYDLDRAVISLRPKVHENTIILPLLNGADIPARIRYLLHEGIVLPACVFVGTHVKEPGVIASSGGDGKILLGKDTSILTFDPCSPGSKPYYPAFDPGPLLRFLEAMGVSFQWHEDPFPAIWTKYIFIASFGLVSVFTGKTMGEIMEDEEALGLVRRIMGEIAAIAKARGIGLPESIIEESVAKGKNFPYETKTSYLRDVESKGSLNEGELYGETIIGFGRGFKLPTPVTKSLYRDIQRRYADQSPATRYQKLKKLCVNEDYWEADSEWPCPFLFHGREFSRDIRFLDPILEHRLIDLGEDPIEEYTGIKYHDCLNFWFHYVFFKGNFISLHSAENLQLLPRLYRLAATLYKDRDSEKLLSFIEFELGVLEPEKLVDDLIGIVEKLIDISLKNTFLVWGDKHPECVEKMNQIAKDVSAGIDFALYHSLPHIRWIVDNWTSSTKKEKKEYSKAIAAFNKRKKLKQKEMARSKSRKQ